MPILTINQKFLAAPAPDSGAAPSDAVTRVAEMFGIGLDETFEVALYDRLPLDVRPGDVVYITGPSGGGKSVLLRLIEDALRASGAGPLVNLAAVDLPDGPRAIDLMQSSLDESLRLLSAAGLADPLALLRPARELSEGQRYRLRLAVAIKQTDCGLRNADCGTNCTAYQAPAVAVHSALRAPHFALSSRNPQFAVLLADEFCSMLDRRCARALAYRVQRLTRARGITLLAATAHDDLLEDLAPDVLVVKHEGPRVEVTYADPAREGDDRA
ncbi:MAG: hypothetical protein IMZ66_12820 [Planctomycetes bacterium]|nr:hypothetical protein [Planctomycetota bacterium]